MNYIDINEFNKLKEENDELKKKNNELEDKLKSYTNNHRHKKYYDNNTEVVKERAKNYMYKIKETNPEKLKAVLLYHVVSGDITSDKIKPGMVKTLSGQDIDITIKDGKVYVNNAEVVKADAKASNGVIHVVNQVLLPKE